MDENQVHSELQKYKFYHVFPVTKNVATPGWGDPGTMLNQQAILRAIRAIDLKDKRVLDIGCRDGMFSFEAEKLGAREVIGIDSDVSRGAVEFLIPFFKSKVKMHEISIYDLTPEMFGKFDVIFFFGVLYHLRYPFWGLKCVKDLLTKTGQLLVETAVLVDDDRHAMLYCPIGADSPYEPTSCTFFNTKALVDTMTGMGMPVTEVRYLKNEHQNRAKLWLRFKRTVKLFLGLRQRIHVDRAIFFCDLGRADSETGNDKVESYWHGKHHAHTVHRGILN
jgi:SAM-dependent methyltransferase